MAAADPAVQKAAAVYSVYCVGQCSGQSRRLTSFLCFSFSLSSWSVALISGVFHRADFIFLHQGYFHLFLCFVVFSMLKPPSLFHHAALSCHLASLSGSARPSLVIRVLKFPRFHFSVRRDVVFISLLHKFVIFFSQFVIMFFHLSPWVFFYHCTNQLNQFQMDQWDFFLSPPVSVSERTWKIMCSGLDWNTQSLLEGS